LSNSTAETAAISPIPAASALVNLTGPTLGSGPDTLSLEVSQDYWQGSAQFTVEVNGTQIGGVQTVDPLVLNPAGGTEIYTLKGDFSSANGSDTIRVNYLNDAWGGTSSTDRNLYVNGISLDGKATSSAMPTELNITESKSFTVAAPAPAPPPVILTGPKIGIGSDTLALTVSQDYWQGSAQFTVDVNGTQIGGVQTVDPSVLNSGGGAEIYTLKGDFSSASGSDTVKVNYLNDAWGGTASTDRNLYVNGISLDGTASSSIVPTELNITESKRFTVAAPKPAPAPTPVNMTGPTIGSGPDTLSLKISQDYWQGSAQFTVDVNGTQIGGVQTVDPSVLHSAGSNEIFTFKGDFSTVSGTDTVGVNFTNDAYGGSPSTDRNLYVTGLSLDGNSPSAQTASLMTNSTAKFDVAAPMPPAPASSFNYSVQYSDPNNYAGTLAPTIEADMNAALQSFEGKIYGTGTLTVQLDIVPTSSANAGELADGGPTALVPQGMLDGRALETPAALYELRSGTHVPGFGSDILVEIPSSALGELYFDPNPAAGDSIASVAPSKYDALTVFRHEITHGLGFISLRDTASGTLGSMETKFDHYSSITASGADLFTGPAAEAVYGGSVPITTLQNGEQYSHLGNDPNGSLASDLMSGIGLQSGVTHQISTLDLAILKDIGVPETGSSPGAAVSMTALAPSGLSTSNPAAATALQAALSAANLSASDITLSAQTIAGAVLGSRASQLNTSTVSAALAGYINNMRVQPVVATVVTHA
jgi:hypothetical protein